jgi:hypothetical protein
MKTEQHTAKIQWVTKVIREELKKKFLESNEDENTTYQNLWDTAKAMLKVPILKTETFQKTI